MKRYSGQAMEIVSGTTSPTSGILLPPTRTHNYDALMEQAATRNNFLLDAPAFHRIFDEIGEVSNSIRQRQDDAIYLETIDIDIYTINKVEFGSIGVEIDFNESAFKCGETNKIRVVVCADRTMDMPAGEVLIASMTMVGRIPLDDPDRSYIYSLVVDSDGDPANDWQIQQPFDWDLFQGADRWYQLIWDHRAMEWSVTVTQLTASGGFPASMEASSVRAVVLGDTVVLFVSMHEFSVPTPGVRLTAFHHDGNFGEATRGADVSGVEPTAPLEIVPDELIEFGW